MEQVRLIASGIRKKFTSRTVLNNIDVDAHSGECLGIIGANGSGKSTLLRILGGLLRPDSGTTSLIVDGNEISYEKRNRYLGLVAPYLNIYEEFSPLELLELQSKFRGRAFVHSHALEVLERTGLAGRSSDLVRTLSSGLRQRVMIALAVHIRPAVLLFDEPSVTLDTLGRGIVAREIEMQLKSNGIVLLATNDEGERVFCTREINVSS